MVAAVHFVAVLLNVATTVIVADEYFEGDGTSYSLGTVRSGNCNFMSAIPTASTNFVALNEEQWDTFGNCGRCVEVSCIDDKCTAQNKTAVVQVLDQCPGCAYGALDLSSSVFSDITGLGPDRLTVRWRFVECPSAGNVQVCLKEGSSGSWIAVQPTNSLVGIKSVTLNGATTTMLDGAYYYVSTTANANLSALKVAITSVNDDVISGTYSLSVGNCTDTMKQFTSGSSSQTETQTPLDTPYTPAATTAPAAATPKTTQATPTSEYTPVTPEAQQLSKGAIPEVIAPKVTLKDTPNVEATQEATAKTPPVTLTSEYTPVTPEAQTPSKGATRKGTTLDATTPATTTTSEAKSQYSPVTLEAQETSMNGTPEATTIFTEATKATDAPTQPSVTSKCHMRSQRRRN